MRVAGDREHPLRVAPTNAVGLARLLEALGCKLADRLEHPEPLLIEAAGSAPEQALVEKRCQRVEVGLADVLGSLQRAAATEDT